MPVLVSEFEKGTILPDGQIEYEDEEAICVTYDLPEQGARDDLFVSKVWYPEDRQPFSVDVVTGDLKLEACIRRDGCINLRRYYNGQTPRYNPNKINSVDYMHICNLEQFIEDLVRIRDVAREFCGEEW